MYTAFRLPPSCHIRPALAKDIWPIRRLVFSARLDPTQLRWQQFSVIEHEAKILACGQLRTFPGCQELGSLVVTPAWRRQGLGTALAQHLTQQAAEPLYIECLGSELAAFYQQLGFIPLRGTELPPALRRKFGISQAIARILHLPLYQMRWPSTETDA